MFYYQLHTLYFYKYFSVHQYLSYVFIAEPMIISNRQLYKRAYCYRWDCIVHGAANIPTTSDTRPQIMSYNETTVPCTKGISSNSSTNTLSIIQNKHIFRFTPTIQHKSDQFLFYIATVHYTGITNRCDVTRKVYGNT